MQTTPRLFRKSTLIYNYIKFNELHSAATSRVAKADLSFREAIQGHAGRNMQEAQQSHASVEQLAKLMQ